ncbi:DUF6268 family outer membrane beta-barrel protein [Bacteroidota bacterium]
MKRISLTLLAVCIFSSLFSQSSMDLLSITGRFGLATNYENPYQDQKATESGVLVNAKLPIPFSETTIWFSQITYTDFIVKNDIQMPSGVSNPLNLHAFIFQTGLYKKFGNDQGMLILFAPRFMTDFENTSGKNFQPGGIIMYEKKFHDQLRMRFGAMFHNELGGPLLVPIVDTDWQINSKWSLVGMWPILGKLNYHVNENFTAGISHFGLVTSYLMGHTDYEGDYIERTSIDLALFGRIRVVGNFHLEGKLGYALGRSYTQYASDQTVPFRIAIIKFGDERVAKNYLFDPGPIFNISLIYNLPI